MHINIWLNIYIYIIYIDSNETDFCSFETSETFFMLVSKQMKPGKVRFETN